MCPLFFLPDFWVKRGGRGGNAYVADVRMLPDERSALRRRCLPAGMNILVARNGASDMQNFPFRVCVPFHSFLSGVTSLVD